MDLPRLGLGLTQQVLQQLDPNNVAAVLPFLGEAVPRDIDPISHEELAVGDIVVGYFNQGTLVYMSVPSFQQQLRFWQRGAAVPVDFHRNPLYNARGPLAFVGLYQVTSRAEKRKRSSGAAEVVDLDDEAASSPPSPRSKKRATARLRQAMRTSLTRKREAARARKATFARNLLRRAVRRSLTRKRSSSAAEEPKKPKPKAKGKQKKVPEPSAAAEDRRIARGVKRGDARLEDAAGAALVTLSADYGIEVGHDVPEDGNCFYGAIFAAARAHPGGSLVPEIVAALGGAGVTTQEEFIQFLRGVIAARVRGGEGIDFSTLHALAMLGRETHTAAIGVMSAQFRARFRHDLFLKKYAEDNAETRRRFYDEFAKTIEQDRVWAAQAENDIATALLAGINIDLHTVGVAPTDGSMQPVLGGRRQLWLYKPGGGDHYEYFRFPSA